MSNPLSTFVFLRNWSTTRSGSFRWLFLTGKIIGTITRSLLILVLILAIGACVIDAGNAYFVVVTAAPALLLLWLAEVLARYLMRRGGARL